MVDTNSEMEARTMAVGEVGSYHSSSDTNVAVDVNGDSTSTTTTTRSGDGMGAATSLYGIPLGGGWADEYVDTYDFHGSSGTAGGTWIELWMGEDGLLAPDYTSSWGPRTISSPGFTQDSWAYSELQSGNLHNWRSGAPSGIGFTPCFVAGTQVLVGYDEQGNPITKNIEDIQVGDT